MKVETRALLKQWLGLEKEEQDSFLELLEILDDKRVANTTPTAPIIHILPAKHSETKKNNRAGIKHNSRSGQITYDEYARLLKQIKYNNTREYLIANMLYLCPTTPIEHILNLQARHLDKVHNNLGTYITEIHQEDVTFIKELIEFADKKNLSPNHFVFSSQKSGGFPVKRVSVDTIFSVACKKINIPSINHHHIQTLGKSKLFFTAQPKEQERE